MYITVPFFKNYTTSIILLTTKKRTKKANQQNKQCILNNMLKGFLKSGKSAVFKCSFFLYF